MAWGQAIAQTVGGAGNEYGRATDANINTALSVIQNKLMMSEVQSRLKEQELRMKQQGMPTPQGTYQTPQGIEGITFDPNTGKYGGGMIPGTATPPTAPAVMPPEFDKFVASLPKERQDSARVLGPILFRASGPEALAKWMAQESLREPAPKPDKPAKWELRQDDKGQWTWIPASPDDGKPTPTGVKGRLPKGAGAGGGEGGGGSDSVANWAQGLATGANKWSDVPAKLKTAVNNYMKSHQMTPKQKLSQTEQRQQDAINTMAPMIEDIENTLTSTGLKDNNSPIASRVEWFKYNTLKIAPEGSRGDLIRQSAALQVLGAVPWMTIGRSKYLYETIIKHLPSPQDSPKLLWDKTQFLKGLLADQQKTLDKVQGGSMGSEAPAESNLPPPGAKIRDFTQVGKPQ